MAFGLRRSDLQAIAQTKMDDAMLLAANSRFSNAYYLAGYAIEIGLKACIARSIFTETIPEKSFINTVYSHNFKELAAAAGLTRQLREKSDADPTFAANWALVAQWRPEVRYEAVDPYSAQIMIDAAADSNSGVFPWIKTFW